jgi:hypothetical protein
MVTAKVVQLKDLGAAHLILIPVGNIPLIQVWQIAAYNMPTYVVRLTLCSGMGSNAIDFLSIDNLCIPHGEEE